MDERPEHKQVLKSFFPFLFLYLCVYFSFIDICVYLFFWPFAYDYLFILDGGKFRTAYYDWARVPKIVPMVHLGMLNLWLNFAGILTYNVPIKRHRVCEHYCSMSNDIG